MSEDALKKIRALLLRNIRNPRWRRQVSRSGARLIRFVGVITLVSAVATFAMTGVGFFTTTLPKVFAATSRTLLLAEVLRPILLESIVKDDLNYDRQCVGRGLVVDLDQDGWASDLIVTIHPKEEVGKVLTCPLEFDETSAVHLILKELSWSGWRPKYTLLHAFYLGVPTHFYMAGPFVVATTAARVNPGYHIYAYGNGVLHAFGAHRSSADEPLQLQLGRRLFMKTYDEFIRSFEITASGEPRTQLMTGLDIVIQNNTAVVIEDERRWSDEAKATIKKARSSATWVTFGDYERRVGLDQQCKDFAVFENGNQLDFKMRNWSAERYRNSSPMYGRNAGWPD